MVTPRRAIPLCILLVAGLSMAAEPDGGGWSYDGNLRFESDDGRFQVDLVNRLQARLTMSNPKLGESGRSFDVERLRVMLDGRAFEHWDFTVQADLATGSLADDEEESDLLLDANLRFAKWRAVQLWIGQGKVGFGRQQMIDTGRQQFVDRSIATERFTHGRDVGIALTGHNRERTYEYSVGLYNGNGINDDADENRDYLAAGRLVVYPLGPMPLTETDPNWNARPEPRLALGVSVMTNNTGDGSFEEERINSAALELAFRVRGLSLAAEFFTESEDELTSPSGDESDTDGWYAQAGYSFPVSEQAMLELAGRYSEILFDVADADQTETGGAVSLYFSGHGSKLQLDYRALEFEGLPFGSNIDTDEARLQFQLIF